MKKILTLLCLLLLFAHSGKAQVYLEPLIGWQSDLSGSRFKQLNTGLQLSFKKKNRYELFLQLQRSWPVKKTSVDSAFTPNISLPLAVGAVKSIKPAAYSFSVGQRIAIAGAGTPNVFFMLTHIGISHQRIAVDYQYDHNNYTILNPDKTLERIGIFLGAGAEYMRLFKKGRGFLQLTIATPPIGKKNTYPSSFRLVSPLAFNAGYSFNIKKKT